jgi:hypothetical protein
MGGRARLSQPDQTSANQFDEPEHIHRGAQFMRNDEITTTVAGNLTGDPELRFTPISRAFALSEALLRGNSRVGGR